MIWVSLGLAAVGLVLSAFFSGSETGFYRVARVRLVLDALGGDLVARGLLWLTNHPSLFVATTLVGNNLANYLVSAAIVTGTQAVFHGESYLAELIAPILFAPLLFVYGELLPKNLFLHAPNRLLRRGGLFFLICVPLFFPISWLLWGFNKILAKSLGESSELVRLVLARRELQRVLEEAHEAGILRPAQRQLAQGIFSAANQPISRYATRLRDLPRARTDMSKQEVLRMARRYRIPAVAMEENSPERRLIGYLRVIDLGLDTADEVGPMRPLLEIPHDTKHVAALIRMQSAQADLARVVDAERNTVGILTLRSLREPLLRGGK